jgi:hypothetical protein
MQTFFRKSMKARELPLDWQRQGRFAPDDDVSVLITPVTEPEASSSPKRFIGAGRGLFQSAREVDAYLRRSRDAWRS